MINFPFTLPLSFLSISLHIGSCLCIFSISSRHLGQTVSAPRPSNLCIRPAISATFKHRLCSTVKTTEQHLSLGYLYASSGVISLSIYISYHSDLWEEKANKFSVHVSTGISTSNNLKKKFFLLRT
jgi:hypothetical protein